VRGPAAEPAYRPAGTDVLSSALDLGGFAAVHLNAGRRGGRRVLSAEAVAAMHTRHAETYDVADEGHGLTFVLDAHKGVRRVGHAGLSGSFAGFVELAPDRGVGAVVLFNRWQGFLDAGGDIVDDVFDRLLGLPAAPPPAPPAPVSADRTRWARYTGRYAGWWTGVATIGEADGRLTLEHRGEVVGLEPVRERVYAGRRPDRAETVSVGFVPEERGPTRWVKVAGMVCERLAEGAPPPPDPVTWRAFEGTYPGAQDTLTVRVEDGQLRIHSAADGEEVACTPVDAGRFACAWGLVEFYVPADGSAPWFKAGQRPLSEPFTYRRAD
jgi:hypothetical protein